MGGRMELEGWRGLLCVTLLLLLHRFHPCQGSVYMTVSPYPARIYQNAPRGVPVLTVQAYDNATGEAVSDFRLEDRGLADYFSINSSGILSTARRIDRTIGFQFKFFVFAISLAAGKVQTEWKHVIIEVGKKNLYPPQFTKPSYDFAVYRYAAPGTLIGRVPASDRDDDAHNRHFTIYAPPRQAAVSYVTVTSVGDVRLAKAPREDVTLLTMVVLAVDDGSPQRTGTTTAVIVVDDINQPSTFCLSNTERDTTLCWKNPMPGRRRQGYNVVVEGQNLVLHKHVKGDASTEEFCVSTSDLELGQNYTFRVTLDDDDSATPPGVELSFHKQSQGFSPDCTASNFNACNFLSPCGQESECEAGQGRGLDYTCDCKEGWQGKNCTEVDECPKQPCRHQGTCLYTGHSQYKCQCPPDYFGQNCQHLNQCTVASPCQNGALCRMQENGTYSCACPDYFTGTDCSVPDPCSPSPCGKGGDCIKMTEQKAECLCYTGYRGERCQEEDQCRVFPAPCVNGGTCSHAANGSFTCACPPHYTGRRCEVFSVCPRVCQNNATCSMGEDGRYNCTCLPAYHGQECQYYNRCHGDPCHNGTCNMDDSMPLCSCDPGFFGPVCEEYNSCLTNPCGEHGDCRRLSSGPLEKGDLPYECDCYDGWWGLQCQFPDLCHQGTCQNGAKCRNTPPNNTKCDCVGGHYGDRCQLADPCYTSPCLNGGHCRNLTTTLYTCTCLPGFSGTRCQHETSCDRLTGCSNGGFCEDAGDGTVRCKCQEGYLGHYCQLRNPCFDAHGEEQLACEHGRCESVNQTLARDWLTDVEDADILFRCHCDEGYSGKRCEVKVLSCDEVRCLNSGDCLRGVCVCPPGFTGSQCELSVTQCGKETCGEGLRCVDLGSTHTCVCINGGRLPDCQPVCRSEEMVSEKTGRYVWPETAAGHAAKLPCPYGSPDNQSSFSTRPCLLSPLLRGAWGEVDDSHCNEMGLLTASRILNELKDLTSHPASLGTSEMQNYTSLLEVLYPYTLLDHEVASLLMNVISNLADVNISVTIASDVENNVSERLLNLLDKYTADVNLTSGGSVSITTANFEVMAVSVQNTSSPVTFQPSISTGNGTTEKLQVSITIPPEAFATERSQEVTWKRKSDPLTRKANGGSRVQLTGHRKSQLFIPRAAAAAAAAAGGGGGGDYSEDAVQSQPVISASVTGRRVTALSTPVVYSIKNRETESNYTCVFWNPKNHSWSTEGVETVTKSGNFTLCQSLHLTSFAVLLDPSPHYKLSATHEAVLSYISYIGSAVSLFCLVLTIITYALFRSLNKDKSGKILLHLCVALLLLNAVFLASGLASSDDRDDDLDNDARSCAAVGAILHYLLLASLAWMLVEAVEMYRALVTVFAKYAQCYMLKRCLLGWGLPIVIVGITLAVDPDNYNTDGAFCFISRTSPGAYYGALVAPACLVLLTNTVIFILVTRVILKPRFQQQKQKGAEGITPAQVRGAFTVMFLLGVTWVFGPLAIKEAKVVFNYLFCVLNSLQGFLIFVFRCVFNPEVRMCWVQLLKTGTLKKRRGPVRSNVYSDTSSKAEGKSGTFNNGSHGVSSGHSASSSTTTTTKTSLRTSNGWHPKLNGFSGGSQIMERRGTKFSTLDFSQGTPESVKKAQKSPLTKEERYGDGSLDPVEEPVLDYYETGHDGHVVQTGSGSGSGSAVYDDDLRGGDGDDLDYYESMLSSRREGSGGEVGGSGVDGEDTPTPAEGSGDSGSALSEKKPSEIKGVSGDLTYL